MADAPVVLVEQGSLPREHTGVNGSLNPILLSDTSEHCPWLLSSPSVVPRTFSRIGKAVDLLNQGTFG